MGDHLPPGQKETTKFPVLHIGDVPSIDLKNWRLTVSGEINNPLELTHDEILALPRTRSVSDFHCVTSWTRFNNQWEGLLFRDLAQLAKPKQTAKFISFEAEFDYHTNLPLETAMDDDVLLAYRFDGADVTPEHGWPLRLVVPKKYAYKSAKWLTAIKFLSVDNPGYWEQRGYSNSADPWQEERLS